MNALPLKTRRDPSEILDDLIADHGFLRVLGAFIARTFRRSRPPDASVEMRLPSQPRVDLLSDHMRRDLGLPPQEAPKAHVDLSVWARRDLF